MPNASRSIPPLTGPGSSEADAPFQDVDARDEPGTSPVMTAADVDAPPPRQLLLQKIGKRGKTPGDRGWGGARSGDRGRCQGGSPVAGDDLAAVSRRRSGP